MRTWIDSRSLKDSLASMRYTADHWCPWLSQLFCIRTHLASAQCRCEISINLRKLVNAVEAHAELANGSIRSNHWRFATGSYRVLVSPSSQFARKITVSRLKIFVLCGRFRFLAWKIVRRAEIKFRARVRSSRWKFPFHASRFLSCAEHSDSRSGELFVARKLRSAPEFAVCMEDFCSVHQDFRFKCDKFFFSSTNFNACLKYLFCVLCGDFTQKVSFCCQKLCVVQEFACLHRSWHSASKSIIMASCCKYRSTFEVMRNYC